MATGFLSHERLPESGLLTWAGQGAVQKCKLAIQTNNVEVDDRGYIYIVDVANTGMHILQLSGEARRLENLP